jgi:hypothetical protein
MQKTQNRRLMDRSKYEGRGRWKVGKAEKRK